MATEFERHYDNIGEIIDAQDVNELQDVININEQNMLLLKDVDFEDYAIWVLENTLEFQRLWLDTFGDKTKIDTDKSFGTVYISKDRLVKIRDDQPLGEVYSKLYTTEKNISKVMLLAYAVKPYNTDVVNFEISINSLDWEDIEPNTIYDPVGEGQNFQLKARMAKNSQKGPILYRWALLWG